MLNTIPNWITAARLLAIPFMFGFLTKDGDRLGGTGIFLAAALTDWLDGYLARRLDQVSDFGKFLDPLVDKLLVIAALLILLEFGQIPSWAVFVIVAREILITAWRGNPTGTAMVGANIWGKAKTVGQIMAIAALLLNLPQGLPIFWLAVGLTAISGISYLLPAKPHQPPVVDPAD